MTATSPSVPSSGAVPRWVDVAAAALIAGAALAAYHNSFSGPFVFDDIHAIVENPTIRAAGTALFPPADSGLTVSGRPLLNLSLALNYALGGTHVWGYHAVNLLLHILAGLTLFGVVRQALQFSSGPALVCSRIRENADLRSRLPGPAGDSQSLTKSATLIALAIAVLWTVHPLQTESVTYVIQRAEVLVALFYLLTLYCFIRGVECHAARDIDPGGSAVASDTRHLLSDIFFKSRGNVWFALSVAACALGMASKEVMVTAPLLVLLLDRTIVAGSFREAWRQRWRLYLGLAGTWLVLAWLVAATGGRGHTAGFVAGMDWRAYALTQCRAVLIYLKLSVWPHPLVFDYGNGVVTDARSILPHALVLALLVAGTLAALWSAPWRRLGLLGAWFFAILAPTSSVVPVATQTMAEHRMYLPLAAVIALGVLGLHALIGRRGLLIAAALAVVLGTLTVRRNADYRRADRIWADTLAKCPDNPRAHSALGDVRLRDGHAAEAIPLYEEALRLRPDYAEYHGALGNALAETGRLDEGLAHLGEAVRLAPADARMHTNLGNALQRAGRLGEALDEQRTAARLAPSSVDVRFNLANTLVAANRPMEAVDEYREALRLQPDFEEARFNLGNTLAMLGRRAEAIAEYRGLLRRDPALAVAWCNLGHALEESGEVAEAAASYAEALRRAPDMADARDALARLRATSQ